jgi:N-acetylmuramoyl-L-alanine amidase
MVAKILQGSVRLAWMIENEFSEMGRKRLGVLQRNEKGIWVLQATNMPAVLIETGFITNQDEEDYLNSEKGQNEMAEAITRAVVNYKNLVDAPRSIGKAPVPSPEPKESPNPGNPVKPVAVLPSAVKKG